MNLTEVESMSRSARSSSWFGDLARFGATLRRSVTSPGQLFLLGTPAEEPWHLTAHLETLARWRGVPELTPTLVRWQPPPNPTAPGVAIDGLRGGEKRTVFVLAEGDAGDPLLERLDDLRRRGTTVLGMAGSSQTRLDEVAHEVHTVPDQAVLYRGPLPVTCDFEATSHLLGLSAAASTDRAPRWRPRLRALSR